MPRFAPAGALATPEAQAQAEQQNRANEILKSMLAAIAGNHYEEFLLHGHDIFKAQLGKDTLAELSGELGRRVTGGYEALPLGSLRQSAYVVFDQEEYLVWLWKLEFRDQGDDRLVSGLMLKRWASAGILGAVALL